MNLVKGKIIGGEFGKLCVRRKSKEQIQLGELLVSENKQNSQKTILQVYELLYGSQISQTNLELISGLRLEQDAEFKIFDENLRNYVLALMKPLITIESKNITSCKLLPDFFSDVRAITKDDLDFITRPNNPLFLGNLRSGNQILDFPIYLNGKDVFPHHILVPATTGRGKSNMVKVMLWSIVSVDYCGVLVLDPHDEYYGRNGAGLKDHSAAIDGRVIYYTPKNPPPGTKTLAINLNVLKPIHFSGVVSFSDAQIQAMNSYHKHYKEKWIESVILEKSLNVDYLEATIGVLKRRLLSILDIKFDGDHLEAEGVFKFNGGESTVANIISELEQGKTVVVDTSNFAGSIELLIGSLISSELFNRYQRYKSQGKLSEKPVISVVLEEAPRVLGKEVLEKGSNIFARIAREGRKFKIGLLAITQLPSLIPRQILANMNTKIVLGLEMKAERQAIMDSASQDLSTDDRNIASLDRGEALITSNFTRFAIPIKVPLFEKIVDEHKNRHKNNEANKANEHNENSGTNENNEANENKGINKNNEDNETNPNQMNVEIKSQSNFSGVKLR